MSTNQPEERNNARELLYSSVRVIFVLVVVVGGAFGLYTVFLEEWIYTLYQKYKNSKKIT